MQQASVMAGVEGERPQNKEGGQPPRAFMGGDRYERSEVHSGGTPMVDTRLRNGVLQDISHLYTWLGADGQKRWWTERQSITSFLADVRAGKERKDPRYEHIPEDHIPSTIIHATEIIYSREKKPREGDNHWVRLSYITSSGQPEQQSEISILDSPIAEAGKDAAPKPERGREREAQDGFAAGREKNDFQEDARQRRSQVSSGDQNHYNPGQGEQRNKQSQGDANTADTQERGDLYADIGLSAPEFKARVAEVRELLRTEQQRYGQGFNEGDFLRERIEQGIRHLVDRDLDKWDDELIASYEDLANGWDVMAFDRYSPQTQRRELEENGYNLALFRTQGGVLVRKKAAAMLDIMATAIDLPHTLAQQIDPRDPRQKTYGQAGFDSEESLKRNYLIKSPTIKK